MGHDDLAIGYDGVDLPFSPEVEQSVLGVVLLDSTHLDRVTEILPRPDYFHQINHVPVYGTIPGVFTLGQPVDFITVLKRLKDTPHFDESAGKTYLMQLTQIVPSISNVETYAEIVRDKYDVRSLIRTARSTLNDTCENGADASTLLDSAGQQIFDIRHDKNIQGPQRASEVILETFDRLDLLNSPDKDIYQGVLTGIKAPDDTITGLNRFDLLILAARLGTGKTGFALNIVRHAVVVANKRVASFSLEMSKEQLASCLLSTEAFAGGTRLRTGQLSEGEWMRLIETGDILSRARLYFGDSSSITVPEMKAKARRLEDVDMIMIDYLQLMSSSRRIDSRVQEISEITRDLKIMAKELRVPVLTPSQLACASEKHTEHRPALSDLRGSGSIGQDAGVVLFLYREDYYQGPGAPDEGTNRSSGGCIVTKNRHDGLKIIPLRWQGEFIRFTSQGVVRSGQRE